MVNKPVANFFLIYLLSSCFFNVRSDEPKIILLETIGKDNQPLNAETVKWWYTDAPDKKNTLQCKPSINCSKWLIVGTKSRTITFFASVSIAKKDDLYCWDWFEGLAERQSNEIEKKLTLLYQSTFCK